LAILNSVTEHSRQLSPATLGRPRASVVQPSPVVNDQVPLRVQVGALKVLALSLITRIEALERGDDASPSLDLQKEVRGFEAELIRNALIRTGGRQRRAARLLGMKVSTINTKIRRYNIDVGLGNSRAS
jgi:DNA-binding NtrC family response regulator